MLAGGTRIRRSGLWALVAVLSALASATRVTTAAPASGNGAGGAGVANTRPRVVMAKAKSAFDLPLARVRFAWSSPLGQRNDLYAVHGTTDGARAWAVGATGTIISLRGADVRIEESGTELDLYGVWVVAADDVWAVGERGTILHRDGRAWKRVASGTKLALYAIWARNAGEIWIGGEGGTILQGDGHGWQPSPTGSKGAIVSLAPCGKGAELCALDRAGLLPAIDLSNKPCDDPDGECNAEEPAEAEGDRVLRLSNGRWSSYVHSSNDPRRLAAAGAAMWLADDTVLRVVRDGRVVRDVPLQIPQQLVRLQNLWAGGDGSGWLVGERCQQERLPQGDYICDRGALWHLDGKGAALSSETPGAPLNSVWGWSGGAVAVGARGNIMRFDGTTWTTVSQPPTDADLCGIWVDESRAPGAGAAPITVRLNAPGTGAQSVDLAIGDGSREIWGPPRRVGAPAGREGRVWLFGDCEALAATESGSWEPIQVRACTPGMMRTIVQIGATDVWVGPTGGSAFSSTAAERWDGKDWSTVRSPSRPPVDFWGARPEDVWITAGQDLLHWDGSSLSRVPAPPEIEGTDLLVSIWGASANDVWAVASSSDGVKLLRFDGTRWRFETAFRLSTPRRLLPRDEWLVTNIWSIRRAESRTVVLWGTSAGDIWLVGPNGVALRYDGTRWSRVRTPTRAGLLTIGGTGTRVIAAGMAGVVLTATPRTP